MRASQEISLVRPLPLCVLLAQLSECPHALRVTNLRRILEILTVQVASPVHVIGGRLALTKLRKI